MAARPYESLPAPAEGAAEEEGGGPPEHADAAEEREAAEQQHGWQPWHRATAGMESLDFEDFDSPTRRGGGGSLGSWLVCLFVGVTTALTALAINLTVENLAGVKFVTTSSLLHTHGAVASFAFFVTINVSLAAAASAVTVLFAPAAAGSGIGDVKAYLNGVDVPGVLRARTLAAKVVGSAGSVAGGLAVGKEGPFVHIGATIGALAGQGGTQAKHVNWRWLAALRNDRDRRDFVTCGASCGVAAAFRAPVGGLLFALEELATHWRPELTWRCFAANAACVVTMRAAMRWCAGGTADGSRRCGDFDATGALFLFDISPETGGQEQVLLLELLPMAALAVVGGLLGAAFNAASEVLCTWRRDVIAEKGAMAQVCEAAALAFATSCVCFAVPLAFECSPCPRHLGDCPRSAAHPTGNFVGFGCAAPGHYNDLATLLFNTPEAAIRNLFSSQTAGEFTTGSLVTFMVLFFTLSLATYGIALPSGLFVPSALCGATYGRLMGAGLVARFPGANGIQEGTYALLGAAAFLGGATRMTVSLCVILLELTANLTLLPSIMAVLLIAKATGDLINSAVYDTHIGLKRIPLLGARPDASLHKLTATQLVAHQGGAPVTLRRVERVSELVALLRAVPHNGFPVLRDDGGVAGLVLRSTLVALLRARACLQASPATQPDAAAAAAREAKRVDTQRWGSTAPPSVASAAAALSAEDMSSWLDLGPWLNAAPHTVQPDAPLSHVHDLFRSLGLRHLLVLARPPGAGVLGVVTRKDLLSSVIRRRAAEAERADDLPLLAVRGRAAEARGTEERIPDAGRALSPRRNTGRRDEEA
jgi:chloride channel 7